MSLVSKSDWVIDMGPGAGDEGGKIIAQGKPEEIARSKESKTAPYLMKWLQ
jgi:excinuclease ABC subunit A